MGIDEHLDSMGLRLLQHGVHIVEILLIVNPRTLMLYGLPCHEEAFEAEPPFLQPSEMFVGFCQREGTTDE